MRWSCFSPLMKTLMWHSLSFAQLSLLPRPRLKWQPLKPWVDWLPRFLIVSSKATKQEDQGFSQQKR